MCGWIYSVTCSFSSHFSVYTCDPGHYVDVTSKTLECKGAQKVPTALAEVCALTTGINYPLGLTAASQMSIIQDMGMTVNTLQKQMEPTVQSKLLLKN